MCRDLVHLHGNCLYECVNVCVCVHVFVCVYTSDYAPVCIYVFQPGLWVIIATIFVDRPYT